jgi:heptose I phosphotransferase
MAVRRVLVAEHYLAEGFAQGELARARSARVLLDWASDIAAEAQSADVYRYKEGRKTLRFVYRGKPFFLKQHTGIGWAEVFKNLIQLRLPVMSASNEYHAVLALQRVGVHTLTVGAYALAGWNPAALRSMIVTAELTGTVTLEDYCANWAGEPPLANIRLRLLCAVADMARRMHRAGINHRDFYLCHFHLDESSFQQQEVRCYLIDLHRAQLRDETPLRWRIKDLAGLFFSAMDCGLTRRDLLRFMHHYTDGGLRRALGRDRRMWRQVERQAAKLYLKVHGAAPPARSISRG